MTTFTKKRVTFATSTKKNDGLSFENAAFDELVNSCLCNDVPFLEALNRPRIHTQKSKVIKKTVVWIAAYFELLRQYPSGVVALDDGNEKKWKLQVLKTGGGNNIAVSACHVELMAKLKKEVDEYQLHHYSVKKIQKIFKKCMRLKRKNPRIYLNLLERCDLKVADAIRYGAKWDSKTTTWYVKKSVGVGARLATLRFGVKNLGYEE